MHSGAKKDRCRWFGRFLVLGLCTCSHGAVAQGTNDLQSAILTFRKASDDWSGEELLQATDGFASLLKQDPTSPLLQYWHGVASVHCCLHQQGNADTVDKKQRSRNLKRAHDSLTRLLKLDPENGEAHAMMATLTGLQIAARPWTGIARGPSADRSTKRALALGMENPRVHYLIGSNCFHGPSMLGGWEQAREHFEEAERLYQKELESNRDEWAPGWGYSSCLFFLARILEEEGRNEEAIAYLERAQRINPADERVQRSLQRLSAQGGGT